MYNKAHDMIVKDPFHSADHTSWNTATGCGILTQLLGLKIHDVEDAVTVLFSNGLIVANDLEKRLGSN